MEFSSHEYWGRLPFPTPEDLPNPGIEPMSLSSSALASRFFAAAPPGDPKYTASQCSSNYGIPTPEKVIQSDIQETDIQLM